MIKDVVSTAQSVRDFLQDRGFVPRDADLTDLQRGDDSSLRFKVGTSYGEVSIQVWIDNKHERTIRVISSTGLDNALTELVVWTGSGGTQ